ncbi:MAG TPA: hypothetical protein VEJ39_02625 [Candidatus Acidoferrales bacterium]|nr:hypothetical protein [Candidatus Acidoferrales bacterium]
MIALRHGLLRRLPLFAVYLASIALADFIRLSSLISAGFSSHFYFWSYWVTQVPLLILRGLIVAEICRVAFSKHSGVWKMCRVILGIVAVVLCSHAVVAAWNNQHHVRAFVAALERGLEFAILVTLVLALAFMRYYLIPIDRLTALVSAGLIFYSAVQVINNEFLFNHRHAFDPIYSAIVVNSFVISMLIWLVAVWRPIPAQAPAPVLLHARAYDDMMPEMNLRLRQLNDRLLELLR